MRPEIYSAKNIVNLLHERKIATFAEIAEALGTDGRRTVFRKLKELDYMTSYSHRGSYYTLEKIARFDELGLWSYRDVSFSVHGSLLLTAKMIVERSNCGCFVSDLDTALNVSTKDVLSQLAVTKELSREKFGGRYLYCASDKARKKEQIRARRVSLSQPGVTGPIPEPALIPDELRAAIVLFFSLLDEQQRRLYAGLEALKTGRGGDTLIAELLGLDVSTVAKGRRQLLSEDIEIDRSRKIGGGRKSSEKKRRRSSRR